MNVFYNTILFVKDIKKSKQFYESFIGLKVENDFNSIVFFENHFVIHDRKSIHKTVFGKKFLNFYKFRRSNALVYFETDNLEKAFEEIKNKVTLIHPIRKQEWGQNVFRFFDPDKYIVEIGEAMHLDYLKK